MLRKHAQGGVRNLFDQRQDLLRMGLKAPTATGLVALGTTHGNALSRSSMTVLLTLEPPRTALGLAE